VVLIDRRGNWSRSTIHTTYLPLINVIETKRQEISGNAEPSSRSVACHGHGYSSNMIRLTWARFTCG
jgi:hypothetical protein